MALSFKVLYYGVKQSCNFKNVSLILVFVL